ncbi:MAG: PaaI family thioesterase [Sphingorhabdus sp.]|jgi:uncharacterized protein (TIGR00369 family)|uniref:PaaI family thioesterase n=1 Tax=Sphingorhabdus sp. TaxID=1902408 RepID=UPI0025E6B82F|nr:PaaI family thioesterase [Sphingorhabdus sp.]MCO4091014.1 PaaI family thioesterase [Sphingorhabdus sp.]
MSISTILDRFPTPPCATLLSLDIIEADQEEGRVTIAFTAKPDFCNASGNIQGGFLAAMLDDCMGPAMLIATNADTFPSTIHLNVQFLAPAKPGRLIGKGRVVKIGTTIGFVEADLEDTQGVLIARATASVRMTAMQKAVI